MTTMTPSDPQSLLARRSPMHGRRIAALAALLLMLVAVELRLSAELVGQLLAGSVDAWRAELLLEFRIPRVLLTLMVGSGMAIAGWAMQMATRNHLADPSFLTVNSAAALAVLLLLWASGGAMRSSRALPFAAAGAGTVSALLLFLLVGRRRAVSGSGLLLIGIAMSAMLGAATFLIALNAHRSTYQYILAWLYGALNRASWDYVWLLLPAWWLITLAIVAFADRFRLLALRDPVVIGLGGKPNGWRRGALCLGAAVSAACIGVAGNFAFLGFIAPNLVRMIDGRWDRYPWISAGMGALLLLSADVLGQVVLPPAEVPAGIVIAVIGAPIFVIALLRHRIVTNG